MAEPSSGQDGTAPGQADAPVPFELLAQHAPCPWALLDAAGRYRYVSPAFVETFGYTAEDLGTERDWFALAYPGTAERSRAIAAWCQETGDPERRGPRLFCVRCRDGSDRSVLLRCVALEDGSRLEVFEDVSDLVLHQEALQAANQRLADIIEFLPDPTFVIDRDGTVIAWNRAIEALSGVPKEEMLGRGNEAYAVAFYGAVRPLLIDLVLPGAAEELDAYTGIEAGPGTLVARTYVPAWNDGNGAHLWGKASLLYTPDGEVAGAIESIRDITEQERMIADLRRYRDELEGLVRERTDELTWANESLRHENLERQHAMRVGAESEARLDRIFQQAPIGMAVVSLHEQFLRVNDALCRITGYDRGTLLAMGPYDITHPDDVGAGRDLTARLVRGEIEEYVRDKRYLRPDGSAVCVHITIGVVRDAAGGPLHLLSMIEDVTERVQAEEQLRVYAAALRESNRDLQQFAYVASHDLQEPLRSVISFAQLLERRYRGRLDADADEFIAFIVEGGTRMQRLIQDLLLFSRVDTKAAPLAPTSPAEVVNATLRALEAPIREAGATIAVDDLPAVMADAAQLEQVFTNLIGNAVKYRREDAPLEIAISAVRRNGMVEFSVADNGIGIEPEYFDRIFVIFQRLHTREAYPGTGIGLAIVKRIVERHGGTVRVESTPGQGSTFVFTLPAGTG